MKIAFGRAGVASDAGADGGTSAGGTLGAVVPNELSAPSPSATSTSLSTSVASVVGISVLTQTPVDAFFNSPAYSKFARKISAHRFASSFGTPNSRTKVFA